MSVATLTLDPEQKKKNANSKSTHQKWHLKEGFFNLNTVQHRNIKLIIPTLLLSADGSSHSNSRGEKNSSKCPGKKELVPVAHVRLSNGKSTKKCHFRLRTGKSTEKT